MQRNPRSLLLKSLSCYPSPRPLNSISPSPPKLPAEPPSQGTNPIRPISIFRLSDPLPHFRAHAGGRRGFGGGGEPTDYSKEVDEINLKFAEAREEIESALESKETVYFDEEAECARDAVKSVLDMFGGLQARLPEKDRTALQRSMGLKIEQLKAELQQLDE